MVKNFFKNYWWKLIILGIIIAIDMVTKGFFEGKSFSVITDIFSILSTHNTGAGFSILEGKIWLLIVITIIFILGLIVFDVFYKNKTVLYGVASSMILAGALGNLIDRIGFGYVRDFLYLEAINFPVFNVADMSLCIGIFLIFIYLIFFAPSDSPKEKSAGKGLIKSSMRNLEEVRIIKDKKVDKEVVREERLKKAVLKEKEKSKAIERAKDEAKKLPVKTQKTKNKKTQNNSKKKAEMLIENTEEINLNSEKIAEQTINQYNEDDIYYAVEKKIEEKRKVERNNS